MPFVRSSLQVNFLVEDLHSVPRMTVLPHVGEPGVIPKNRFGRVASESEVSQES